MSWPCSALCRPGSGPHRQGRTGSRSTTFAPPWTCCRVAAVQPEESPMAVSRRQFVLGSSLTATGLSLTGSLAQAAGAAKATPAEQRTPEVRKPAPAASPQDWGWVRSQFRLDPDYAHLSNFYIVSHPQPVRDAIDRYRRGL